MNIYQKLIEVRKEVPYLQKENSGSQYKYVSSSQVLGNCKNKMDELGLLLIPRVLDHKLSESTIEQYDANGRPNKRTITYFTEIDVEFTWVNSENPEEKIVCPWYGQGVDIAGEKGVGKALTYAEKYFMLKLFNIPTDKDDPDSFQQKHDDQKPEQPKQEPKPKIELISEIQQKALIELIQKNSLDIEKTTNILAKYKAKKVSEIKISDYSMIKTELEQLKGAK